MTAVLSRLTPPPSIRCDPDKKLLQHDQHDPRRNEHLYSFIHFAVGPKKESSEDHAAPSHVPKHFSKDANSALINSPARRTRKVSLIDLSAAVSALHGHSCSFGASFSPLVRLCRDTLFAHTLDGLGRGIQRDLHELVEALLRLLLGILVRGI